MHVEPPSGPLMSLKEFGLHYLMIVLSILTALGLEELLTMRHHAEAGHAARAAIEHELLSNLADLREAKTSNAERRVIAQAMGDELSAAIRKGETTATLQKKIAEDYFPKLKRSIGLMVPVQAHQAWDVAVANQSAGFIEPEHLRAYSAAYALEHDALQGANSGMLMLDGPHMVEIETEIELGTIDPKRFLTLVRQVSSLNSVGLANLTGAEEELVKILGPAGLDVKPR